MPILVVKKWVDSFWNIQHHPNLTLCFRIVVFLSYIECISGVSKNDFSTFYDPFFGSILDGIFSYRYSGYLGTGQNLDHRQRGEDFFFENN